MIGLRRVLDGGFAQRIEQPQTVVAMLTLKIVSVVSSCQKVDGCGGRSRIRPVLSRQFVYRLVGTHQVAQRGSDPTGLSVIDAYHATDLEETLSVYNYVVRNRRPFLYTGPYNAPDGLIEDEDIVFLPLSDNDSDVNMVLVYAYSRIYNPRDDASFILRRGQE
ncbi:MAG: hypothetical protein E6Q98_16500 [Rhodospirillaceae bacterium]|nr:MAG: hypothetical protein E6Q98_16500 [Rhodospirillaceae bacterium]